MNETTIRSVEIFRDLSEDELRQLAGLFVEVSVPAGSVVFPPRGPGAFHVIRDGRVVLYEEVAGKRPQVLAELGPGEFFGELGIHDEMTGAVTARTEEASHILEITKDELLRFIERHPSVALRLRMAAARRPRPIRLDAPADERRRERVPVERTVVLMLDDSTSQLTQIENLTADGLCLRGVPAAWERAGLDVRFHLGIGTGLLQLGGRIVWRQEERVGIQFTHKSRSHAMKIQWALRQLQEGEEDGKPPPRSSFGTRSAAGHAHA